MIDIPNASDIPIAITFGGPNVPTAVEHDRWWHGLVACELCGYGTPGHEKPIAAMVVAFPSTQEGPFLLKCPECRNWTLKPDDGEDSDR